MIGFRSKSPETLWGEGLRKGGARPFQWVAYGGVRSNER